MSMTQKRKKQRRGAIPPPMTRRRGPILVGAVVAVCLFPSQASPQQSRSAVEAAIEARFGPVASALRFEADLRRFYRARGYAPIWFSPDGAENRIGELTSALRSADLDGLLSQEYMPAGMAGSRGSYSAARTGELELQLSDAFLRLGHDLARGRVDPIGLGGEWSSEREPFDATRMLTQVSEFVRASRILDELRPAHPQYGELRAALASLHQSSGWVWVPSGVTLRAGDSGRRVVLLRDRLTQSGDMAPMLGASVDPSVFDPQLEEAVRTFQRRHGLTVDGRAGAETLRAINVSVSERAAQVAANLERWRWLPNDLGQRRMIVNVPDFSVTLEAPDLPPMRLKAIVGRTERETPTFSSVIESFSLAPYWNVPENLARKDILPRIREDSLYLDRTGMTVIDTGTGELADGSAIDWAAISDDDFLARYRLRQEPGPANSLGDLRIAFPNPYTVFLHDTPDRALFANPSRALSSGCVRVEQPLDLLEWLLDEDPEWTRQRITEVLEVGEERSSRVRHPTPIHIVYLTALVDEDGRLAFRPDVYGLDGALGRALTSPVSVEGVIAEPMTETCSD